MARRDEYDDYADAVSPVGERTQRAPRIRGGSNVFKKAWGWFNAQPAQTKVLIVGAMLVVGVVIYMAIRNKQQAASTDDSEGNPITTGPFNGRWGLPRAYAPGQAPAPGPLASNGASTPTPSPTSAVPKAPTPVAIPKPSQPAAVPAAAAKPVYPITPAALPVSQSPAAKVQAAVVAKQQTTSATNLASGVVTERNTNVTTSAIPTQNLAPLPKPPTISAVPEPTRISAPVSEPRRTYTAPAPAPTRTTTTAPTGLRTNVSLGSGPSNPLDWYRSREAGYAWPLQD